MANKINGVRLFGDREYLYFETTKGSYQVTVYILDDDGTDKGGVYVISENPNIAKFWGEVWGTSTPTTRGITIKPISYGRTRIKFVSVTDPTKYTYLTVQVGPVSTVNGVQLSRSSVTLVKGGRGEQVRASVDAPAGSTGVSIFYSVNNIASVTTSGTSDPAVTMLNVNPLNVGETVITVRAYADSTRYAKLTVKVVAAEEDIPSGGGEGGGDTPGGGGGSGDWIPRDEYDNTPLRTTATFFDELGVDEVISDITSVGNTLIISTEKNMYYYLWKEGAYHFLGNKIPVPAIYFRMGDMEDMRYEPTLVIDVDSTRDDADQYELFGMPNENKPTFEHAAQGDKTEYGALSTKYVFDPATYDSNFNEYLNSVWSLVDKQLLEQNILGKAVFPIFIRYAVRLYDGTSYAQSIPVLLGADIEKFMCIKANGYQLYVERNDNGMDMAIASAFETFVNFAKGYSIYMDTVGQQSVFDGWDDIVKEVDIFVSRQLIPVQRNAAKIVVEYTGTTSYKFGMAPFEVFKVDVELDPYYSSLHQDELVRFCQNTYLAQSFSIDEFRSLAGERKLDINFSSDYILAQEPLKETPQSMHYTTGSNLFNYNNRLLVTGAEQRLSHGYQFLHSVKWKSDIVTLPSYRFVYYLRGENGENIVICRDENGNGLITPKQKHVVNMSADMYKECPVAWFAYPDSRCYRIDVYRTTGSTIEFASFTTKVFDQADVAYVFLGFGQEYQPNMFSNTLPTYETDTYRMPSTLVVSKPNNPFVFPAEDMVTFNVGEILNIAVATRALSEGQFGQFPLYVFTDEGVFALSVDTQGRFQTSHPVTRDILLNKDSLAGIEQGVFFAAKRGLLLLQGSDVTKVSAEMEGGPVGVKDAGLLPFEVETAVPLSEYLNGCNIAYDYANKRLLIINEAYRTQYVYKFDTQSWHRLDAGFGYPVRALNSYPEALLVYRSGGWQSVYDFSVLEESDSNETLRGLIYSRDLDLEGMDVYKAVRRMKVRGRFVDGHVKWQLQGSNNGIHYTTIHSLRGPSWKWYRFVIVTNLDAGERVSYVEMDYDAKFTDKIR